MCRKSKRIFVEDRKMKRLGLLMCLLLMAGFAQAIDFIETGDGLWDTPSNWDTGFVPVITDDVKISNLGTGNATVAIGPGVDALSNRLRVGYLGGGTINMTGGTLTVGGDDLRLGWNGGSGTFNLVAGTVSVWKDLEIGSADAASTGGGVGVLTMTSGLLTVHDDIEIGKLDSGVFNLNGGTVILDDAFEADSHLRLYATGLLHFGGDGSGKVQIFGDDKDIIQGYIANGWITCDAGLGTVKADLTTNPGYTTVYVIPEPATMVLLGLGGLLLRKRR
jgi:hypothetical protein